MINNNIFDKYINMKKIEQLYVQLGATICLFYLSVG